MLLRIGYIHPGDIPAATVVRSQNGIGCTDKACVNGANLIADADKGPTSPLKLNKKMVR